MIALVDASQRVSLYSKLMTVEDFFFLQFFKCSLYNTRSSSCKLLLIEAKQGNCSNARRSILFLYDCNFPREAETAHFRLMRSESFPWSCLLSTYYFSSISDELNISNLFASSCSPR